MDVRARTLMLCAAFSIAISVSVLLRSRKDRAQYVMAFLAALTAFWYISQGLFGVFRTAVWFHLTAFFSVVQPITALYLFESIVPRSNKRRSWLIITAYFGAIPTLLVSLLGDQPNTTVRALIFLYIVVFGSVGLLALALRATNHPSRALRARVRLLITVGSLTLLFSIVDVLWLFKADVPPVSAVLSVVFLLAVAQSMRRQELVDLYDTVGRIAVSTALAFCLAGVFYAFVTWVNFETMYLNAVLASIAIMVLFEPLRDKVEHRIHAVFYRESDELRKLVHQIQIRISHLLQMDDAAQTVMQEVHNCRRITSAALYLTDPDATRWSLRAGFGAAASPEVLLASAGPMIEQLHHGSIVIDSLSQNAWFGSRTYEVVGTEALQATVRQLGPVAKSGVVAPVRTRTGRLVGMMVVQDQRVRDAFNSHDVAMLERIGTLLGMTVENSQAYQRLKERDRLVDLGQMAAGIAHEIKNPLGAIKGAAQLLVDTRCGSSTNVPACQTNAQNTKTNENQYENEPIVASDPHATQSLINIIIEEVDRLDRLVDSALDYAHPKQGHAKPTNINTIIERTLQLVSTSLPNHISLKTDLQPNIANVRIDAHQFRHILMNLLKNAVQAMTINGGSLTVSTRLREEHDPQRCDDGTGRSVEVCVRDTGVGIKPDVMDQLFVPFFSTKPQGTGLGLAICQRLAQQAHCRIEVISSPEQGTAFTLVCPAVDSNTANLPPPQPQQNNNNDTANSYAMADTNIVSNRVVS